MAAMVSSKDGNPAAHAGVLFAEFFPREAELLVLTSVANGLEALGIRGRAPAGDHSERLMAPQPGAQVHHRLLLPSVILLAHNH